ncbi:hypothetical protein ACRALDRAFT_2059166, partial [Sodiomyces alcalophilus JCM 7366]|uniref:uncharacterized protein n=1 Tax=Sodiomyces alcalophilus JCM 7366 TaxID=591952 RepID=UPI0039B65556
MIQVGDAASEAREAGHLMRFVQACKVPCGQTRCYRTFGAAAVIRSVANASTACPLQSEVHYFHSAGTMRLFFSLSQSVCSLS